jgi:hypothetical protein
MTDMTGNAVSQHVLRIRSVPVAIAHLAIPKVNMEGHKVGSEIWSRYGRGIRTLATEMLGFPLRLGSMTEVVIQAGTFEPGHFGNSDASVYVWSRVSRGHSTEPLRPYLLHVLPPSGLNQAAVLPLDIVEGGVVILPKGAGVGWPVPVVGEVQELVVFSLWASRRPNFASTAVAVRMNDQLVNDSFFKHMSNSGDV